MDFERASEDYQLVYILQHEDYKNPKYKEAAVKLLNKYEAQVHHHWHILQKQMNYSDLVNNIKEEYYSEAYDAFWTSIQKVNLEKVYDSNWKLIGWSNFYLKNVRTKFINEIMDKESKKKSTTSMCDLLGEDGLSLDPDVELASWERDGYKNNPEYICELHDREDFCERAVNKCLSKWSPQQREIFYQLRDNLTRVDIAHNLGIPVTKIYNVVNNMKKDLKVALEIAN